MQNQDGSLWDSDMPFTKYLKALWENVPHRSVHFLARTAGLSPERLGEFLAGERGYQLTQESISYLAHQCQLDVESMEELWVRQELAIRLATIATIRRDLHIIREVEGAAFIELFEEKMVELGLPYLTLVARSGMRWRSLPKLVGEKVILSQGHYDSLLHQLGLTPESASAAFAAQQRLQKRYETEVLGPRRLQQEAEERRLQLERIDTNEEEWEQEESYDQFPLPDNSPSPSDWPEAISAPLGWTLRHFVADGTTIEEPSEHINYALQEVVRLGYRVLDIRYASSTGEWFLGYMTYAAPPEMLDDLPMPVGFHW